MIFEFKDQYKFLSNFWPCCISDESGIIYSSIEGYYQAQKTLNEDLRRQISKLPPGKAKKAGRNLVIRPDWELIRLQVMEYGLRQKFKVNSELAELLIRTGDQDLFEGNGWGDIFWGVCNKTFVGQNNLGKLLMKIRSELQADEYR